MNDPRLWARQNHSRLFAIALIALLLISQPWLASDSCLRAFMRWLGYALVIAGAMGRVYSSVFIGGRKGDLVVRDGPFSIVRNPLYVFSFLAAVGIALESGMLSVVALVAGVYVYYYAKVVAREEMFLLGKFGAAYEVYLRDVPRWIPDFKLWKESEQVEARPKFIRRTLFDATAFFLPLPLFPLISVLQMHHLLPLWLTLP